MFSTVRLIGESDGDDCGYCGDSESSKSTWYIITDVLTAMDYKVLMDSGWRRAQRKVLRNINNYLNTGEIVGGGAKCSVTTDCRGDRPVEPIFLPSTHNVRLQASGDSELPPPSRIDPVGKGRSGSAKRKRWLALQDRMAKRAKELGTPYEVVLEEYRARRQKRLDKNKPKELEECLKSTHGEAKPLHFIEVRMYRCSPLSSELDSTLDKEFKTYSEYQVAVHHDPPEKLQRKGFMRFLVNSPLVSAHDAEAEAHGAPQFGSYHQQYWLDGEKLIGVGVVDLVPGCLSSVYFFYDPAYSFLRLGTYSALREIAFVRHLHNTYGSEVRAYADFTQYYMGYYIHSCAKMRYKALYSPSYLLCPETYVWVPLKRCQHLLDRAKCTRFTDANVEKASGVDISNVVLLLPFSTVLASLLPVSQFTVKDNVIVTTVSAATRLLTKHTFQLLQDWANLVRSTGTMRIEFTH